MMLSINYLGILQVASTTTSGKQKVATLKTIRLDINVFMDQALPRK